MTNLLIDTKEFLYQAIGIVAAVICILSFQIKDNKKFCIAQGFSSILFAFQFFYGGAIAAGIMNSICVVRSFTYAYLKDKKLRISATVLFSILFLTAMFISIFVFKDKWYLALVTGTASVVSSAAICSDNNKIIRWAQLCYVSPCWLFNNIMVRSIGAIITEAFAIVSVIIALIRINLDAKKGGNNGSSNSIE